LAKVRLMPRVRSSVMVKVKVWFRVMVRDIFSVRPMLGKWLG
jgi:hypothetical protein